LGHLIGNTFRCCSSLISRTAINEGTGAVPPYLDLNQACRFPGGVAVLIQRMIRRGLLILRLTYSIWLKRVGGQMRAFVMALLIGVPVTGAAAHDGWFVRVCRAKTEAGRIDLIFSGGRQGYSWSWIKGRTPDEIDLPRRFHSVARLTMRGSTSSTPININPHAYVCIGFRDHIVQRMEFDDHEDHDKNWNDTDDCAC
jgi:hypothetical protein